MYGDSEREIVARTLFYRIIFVPFSRKRFELCTQFSDSFNIRSASLSLFILSKTEKYNFKWKHEKWCKWNYWRDASKILPSKMEDTVQKVEDGFAEAHKVSEFYLYVFIMLTISKHNIDFTKMLHSMNTFGFNISSFNSFSFSLSFLLSSPHLLLRLELLAFGLNRKQLDIHNELICKMENMKAKLSACVCCSALAFNLNFAWNLIFA